MMNDNMRESLSALMDDSANELELERLLKHAGDGELRATWMRYHAVRHSLAGQSVSHLSLDISHRVREAIGNEQTPVISPEAQREGPRSLSRVISSFAVAASVAAVVVVGGLQFGSTDINDSSAPVTAGAVTPIGITNAVPVRATYGTQAVPARADVRAAYRDLARQRMQQLMQEHAEQAALNSPQGLLPYARVEKLSP